MKGSLPLLLALALAAPIIASPTPRESYKRDVKLLPDNFYEAQGPEEYSSEGKSGIKLYSVPLAMPYHEPYKYPKTAKTIGEPTDAIEAPYPIMAPTAGFGGGASGTIKPLPGGQGGHRSGSSSSAKSTGGSYPRRGSGGVGSGGKGKGGKGSGGTGSGGTGSGDTGSGSSGTDSTPSGTASPPSPTPSTPPTNNNTTTTTPSTGNISLPPGCQTKNNIGIGWLPGTDEKIGNIESALGVTACFDGQYAQITSKGAYTDASNQLLPSLTQIVGGQTIFVASLMPSIAMNAIDATVAGGVAAVMKQFTDKGIEVWLRFAHEMNWYVTDGTYHGTAADFQKAWAAVSAAVEGNEQVKMFWSPNQASAADIEQGGWFPTGGKVDVVGIDIYPKSQQTFGEVYGDFCKTFSTAKDLPFAIGETGAGPGVKEYWLGQLAQGDKGACPNYVGFSYFDYNKGEDFRVVSGSGIAKKVLG